MYTTCSHELGSAYLNPVCECVYKNKQSKILANKQQKKLGQTPTGTQVLFPFQLKAVDTSKVIS